jgi:hypothetical protein
VPWSDLAKYENKDIDVRFGIGQFQVGNGVVDAKEREEKRHPPQKEVHGIGIVVVIEFYKVRVEGVKL